MNSPLRRFRATRPPAETPPPAPSRHWWDVLRPPRSARELLGHNAGLKLVSLVTAVFVWATINVSERDAERVLEVPIVFRRIPAGLVVTNPPVKPVAVVLRGPRTILDGINERESRLAVDLGDYGAGDVRIDLTAQMLKPELKRHVKGVRVEPNRVRLTIEPLRRRTLTVRPDLVGMPAFGYSVAGSRVEPATVDVTGPESVIGPLREATTEGIDLRGQDQLSIQRTVPLSVVGDFVNFSPGQVTVTITLEDVMMSRDFRHAEVKVLNGENVKADPGWSDVTVRGPQRILHNFKLDPDAVTIDAAGLPPGQHRLDVHVAVPDPLEVTRTAPDNQLVKIPGGGK